MHDSQVKPLSYPGYRGPERRSIESRSPMPVDERSWRLLNFALASEEQKDTFGRRSSDIAFLMGQ